MIKIIITLITGFFIFSVVAGKKTFTENEINKIVNAKVLEKMKLVNDSKLVHFAKNILKKEEDLNNLEMKLKRKEEELQINLKELDNKINRFIDKQKRFIVCIDNVEKGKKKRINHLVEIIAGMKPVMAGNVLSVQDSDIAVKILSKLPAVKMSKIFNSMDKEISARLQKQYMNMQK